ncbi:MAG: CcdB family protein [Pseudomonadota bacterium]
MQCDIYRTRARGTLLCRIQSDTGADTTGILCAPVVAREEFGQLIPKLHIPFMLGEAPHLVIMSQLVAVPAFELGAPIASAPHLRDEIIAAVDLLVSGF